MTTETGIVLALALLGPPALAWITRPWWRNLAVLLLGDLCFAGLVGIVLVHAIAVQGLSFGELGLTPPTLVTPVLGGSLAALFIFGIGPALGWLFATLGTRGFEAGLARVAALPTWYVVVAVVIGGVAEEILYRGYAFGWIWAWSGSGVLAALATGTVFGAAHIPLWGSAAAIAIGFNGLVFTIVFAVSHDLWANMIAHILTDMVGIVLPSARAQSRKLSPE